MKFKFAPGDKVRISKHGSMDRGIEGVVQSVKDVEGDISYLIKTEKLGRFLVFKEEELEMAWL